jgi:hypothetical protein
MFSPRPAPYFKNHCEDNKLRSFLSVVNALKPIEPKAMTKLAKRFKLPVDYLWALIIIHGGEAVTYER